MPVTEKLLYFCYYKFYMTTLAHQFSLSMVFDSLQPHGLYSTPGFPVHQQLLELAQTHVHPFSYAIQPSYPLSPPSPSAPNLPSIRVFSNESVL